MYKWYVINTQDWHFNGQHGLSVGGYLGANSSGLGGTYIPPTYNPYGYFINLLYQSDQKLKFKSTKTYLFETKVKNFNRIVDQLSSVPNLPEHNKNNFLRIIIGEKSVGSGTSNTNYISNNFWQGPTKIIDYGVCAVGFTGGTYSPAYPDIAETSFPKPYKQNINYSQVLQFFSKPDSDFEMEYSTGYIPVYPFARFQAHQWFGASLYNINVNNNNYPGLQNTPGSTAGSSAFIQEFKISEIDFEVQGWAISKETSYGSVINPDVIGWAYFNDGQIGKSGTYSWRIKDVTTGSWSSPMAPISDSDAAYSLYGDPNLNVIISSSRWITNNFIATEIIDSQTFNLEFDLVFSTQSGILPMRLYLGKELPIDISNPNSGLLIGTFTQSNKYFFYNLNGGSYLYFVGGTTSSPNLIYAEIGNISITNGYSETDNNEQFPFQSALDPYSEPTPLSIIGANPQSSYISVSITDTTVHETGNGFIGAKKLTYGNQTMTVTRPSYQIVGGVVVPEFSQNIQTIINSSGFSTFGFFSNLYGTVSNLSSINSKVGNGKFKAGVWENGVWNSGWRVDENVHEFNDVRLSFNLKTENVRWRIQISGSTYSTSNFEIGDRVSIGNIVAIDINENRKLFKNYFTIVNKNETDLIVEVDNIFPVRRIEKDSENHKILVTKNVWLNGGFLNGYFEGVWSDGVFKGFPYITEMYNSHWVDGKFEGGHFYATKPSFTFQDTYYWDGYVGLTFGLTAHGFLPGDLITIDKEDKTINPQYDGNHTITKIIDNYLAITDINWGDNSSNERGIVGRRTSTGLIQNFTFYDRNNGKLTSKQTRNLKNIWRYDSWIDVNYSEESTTNINSSRIYNNKSTTNFGQWINKHRFGIGDYAVLNLYGYITDDVLSSNSYFRGLDSIEQKAYNLGVKYEIFEDFLGDISNLNNPFDTDPELGNLDNFISDGWTYSFSGIDGGSYSYINNLIKQANAPQNFNSNNSSPNPTWSKITFPTLVEESFGLLITSAASDEWTVSTSGIFNINFDSIASLITSVNTNGLETGVDNDYLYLTGNVTVGQLRLIKNTNGTDTVLVKKTIKTTGGDFNIGTKRYDEGNDSAQYSKSIEIFIDWKGYLASGDKVRLEFQKCQTTITNYNAGGPWRGSGFEQGIGLNDNITSVTFNWTLPTNRILTISNAGVNNSLGFNMRRTTDGTILVEHLENSFHSITLNNTKINIPKNRYSMIEFDLIQSPDTSYQPINASYSFHWTDLYNFTTFINSDLSYSSDQAFPSAKLINENTILGTPSSILENPKSRVPLWSGIDYTKTQNLKKREFFYNRPGLDLGLLSEQVSIFKEQIHELDNIKFYEVNMIPFFKYTTEEYVDKGIKIPYQGNAPFIDYENNEFSLIENVKISIDSIDIQQTTSTYIPQSFGSLIFIPIGTVGSNSTTIAQSRSGGFDE
jgi:hypothetical protein